MQVDKLTVTKGKTYKKGLKWQKVEYSMELSLSQNDDIEQVKEFATMLINSWLQRE